MRLLAVDVGSNVIGLAYFESEDSPPQTAVLRAPAGPENAPSGWLDKLEYFEARIMDRSILWAPDVIAIEDVQGFARNMTALIKLVKAWGWVAHVLKVEYPRADWIEIHTATVRSALGLSSHADRKTRRVAARVRFPQCKTQDEADACCVGMTAYREISKRFAASA